MNQGPKIHDIDPSLKEMIESLGEVASIADLRAIDISSVTSMIRFVKDRGIYRYDPTSNVADDGVKVVAPNVGSGRWLIILESDQGTSLQKKVVAVATTANITLSGLQTIDGIALTSGMIVLVKDQTDKKQNGAYIASAGAWSRHPDMNTGSLCDPGSAFFVADGNANKYMSYEVRGIPPITVGTSNITIEMTTGGAVSKFYRNSGKLSTPSSRIPIGIVEYSPTTDPDDHLMVYIGGQHSTLITEYTIDKATSEIVASATEGDAGVWPADTTYDIRLLKTVNLSAIDIAQQAIAIDVKQAILTVDAGTVSGVPHGLVGFDPIKDPHLMFIGGNPAKLGTHYNFAESNTKIVPVGGSFAIGEVIVMWVMKNVKTLTGNYEIDGQYAKTGTFPKSAMTTAFQSEINAIAASIDTLESGALTLAPSTSIQSVTDSYSGMTDVEIGGATLQQAVVNGDFANGTTGWLVVGSTLSATQKILTATGTGAASQVGTAEVTKAIYTPNNKIFLKTRVRVTNANCPAIRLRAYGSVATGTIVQASSIGSPVQNQWYDLFGIVTLPSDGSGSVVVQIRSEYADAATANGKVMEVEGDYTKGGGVFAIPITGTPYEAYTADQLNDMVNTYWEGLKSAQSGEVVSRGRNLFDKNSVNIVQNKTLVASTGVETVTTSGFISDYTKVNPSTNYKVAVGLSSGSFGHCFYDKSKNFISGIVSSVPGTQTITTPSNARYVRISTIYTNADIQMLNEGSTALPYEPYKESKLAYNCTDSSKFALSELLNGTENEINQARGYVSVVKRNQEYVLQSGDLSLVTTPINFDYVRFARSKLVGLISRVANVSYLGLLASGFMPRYVATDITGVEWSITDGLSNDNIDLIVPKGTYANLSAAQAALAGTKIIYRLATPVFIPYEQFADYGIDVDGSIGSSTDYTNYYETGDIMPTATLTYPRNAGAAIDSLVRSQVGLTQVVDTLENTLLMPVTATANGNVYTVKTHKDYRHGYPIVVKPTADSTGAVSIIVNDYPAQNALKASGSTAIFKANVIYTLRSNGTNFILQGEGGSGNALASDLLSGKSAETDAGPITGTLALTGNATDNLVVAGYTYYNNDAKTKRTGLLVDYPYAQTASGLWTDGLGTLALSMPVGAYRQEGAMGAGVSCIAISDPDFIANNIVSGKEILGVAGVTIARKYATGTFNTVGAQTVTISGLAFEPTMVRIRKIGGVNPTDTGGIITNDGQPIRIYGGYAWIAVDMVGTSGTTNWYNTTQSDYRIIGTSFKFKVYTLGDTYNWEAFGI